MTTPIELESVHRAFGDNEVLTNLSFSIEAGTITGLLGVNGAGKTTMIHCLLGMLKPDQGRCRLYGEESWEASVAVRHKVGFVPQTSDGFDWMTVAQILDYTGAFYDRWDKGFVDQLVERFELDPEAKVRKLSGGMKQRVSIVLALGHQPELLVLDEPVAALDPVGRRAFIELLLDLHLREGRTVLFSTHITSDVERVAADVALLQHGEVALHCNLEDLKQRYCRVHIHSQRDIAGLIAGAPGCLRSEAHGNSARLTLDGLDPEWHAKLRAEDHVEVQVENLNLEEIFLELAE